MENQAEQFDDVDARLLAYLVQELPADQQQAIKDQLSTNAGLRKRLDELRATYEMTWRALEDTDRVRPGESSLRKLQTALRQNSVKRLTAPNNASSEHHRRRWMLPAIAAAAMLLIGLFIWRNRTVEQFDEDQFAENIVEVESYDIRRDVALDSAERELEAVAFLQQTLTPAEE